MINMQVIKFIKVNLLDRQLDSNKKQQITRKVNNSCVGLGLLCLQM